MSASAGCGLRVRLSRERLNRPNYPKIESAKPHKRAHSDYSGLAGYLDPKMKPPQRVSHGGYQSLDSLRDDDCPQRKRADCECYGD